MLSINMTRTMFELTYLYLFADISVCDTERELQNQLKILS